jgi:hypothetical protein
MTTNVPSQEQALENLYLVAHPHVQRRYRFKRSRSDRQRTGDLYDADRLLLIEVKGWIDDSNIAAGLGQVLYYRTLDPDKIERVAVLTPYAPSETMHALFREHGLGLIYLHDGDFKEHWPPETTAPAVVQDSPTQGR